MGRRGRELVRARFRWSDIARDLVTTYGWMQGHAGRPDWVRVD